MKGKGRLQQFLLFLLIITACVPSVDYWQRAKEEYEAKDYLGAIIELNTLIRKYGETDSVLVLRARSFIKAGKSGRAQEDLRTALKLNGGNDEARLELARILSSDDSREAEALLESISAKKGRLASDAWIEYGRIHYFKDGFEESLQSFDKSISADSSNALAWYYRGLMRSSFFDRDGTSGEKIFSFFDFDKALYDFNKAIALQPDFADAWFQRAMVYFNRFDGKRGLSDVNQAIALEPDYSYYYLGRAHYYRVNADPTKALADFNKAIELYGNDPAAFEERAILLDSLGQLTLADKDRETAARLKEAQKKEQKK